ncbi:MAG: peptidylprolyl isomerase [Alteromonadaceae bacterium]|jgi:peptidylprolyl isomerase
MKKTFYCYLLLLLPLFSTKALVTSLTPTQQKSLPSSQQWRTLSPEDTLYMTTQSGLILFELAVQFSPEHIKQLVRSGFYVGLTFYRVIDQYVVQGGDPDDQSNSPLAKKRMKAEFEQTINPDSPFTLVQTPGLMADQTGYVDGFAVGRDLKSNTQWLIHCPGVVNLARSTPADSGGTDFSIMVSTSPPHLDRNLSVFGRIIHGIEHLNLIKRGDPVKNGMIIDATQRSTIVKMQIGALDICYSRPKVSLSKS